MSEPTNGAAEWDLLFGVYLVTYGFIRPEQLSRAIARGGFAPGQDLGRFLAREGLLVEQARRDIEAYLGQQVRLRGGVTPTLTAFGGMGAVRAAFGGEIPLPRLPAPGVPGAAPASNPSGVEWTGRTAPETWTEEETETADHPAALAKRRRWPWVLAAALFLLLLAGVGVLLATGIDNLMGMTPGGELAEAMQAYEKGEASPEETKSALDDYIDNNAQDPLGYFFRSNFFQMEGDYDEALADLEKTMELGPEFPAALNNLAWLLATSPRDDVRDGKRAVNLARQACESTKWKDAGFIDTLAAAYAETGDFEMAVKFQREALNQYDPDQPHEPDLLKQLRSRLALYETHTPYRDRSMKKKAPAPLPSNTVEPAPGGTAGE